VDVTKTITVSNPSLLFIKISKSEGSAEPVIPVFLLRGCKKLKERKKEEKKEQSQM